MSAGFPVDVATKVTGLCASGVAQARVKQTSSKTSGVVASQRNTAEYPIALVGGMIEIITPPSAACGLDVGGAATNVDNAAVFSAKALGTSPANSFYRTTLAAPIRVPQGGYFTAAVASGDLNGADIVVTWYGEPCL